MADSLSRLPQRVERKPLAYGEGRTHGNFVRGGELFEAARETCGFSRDVAAEHYGVSASVLSRQVTNQDNQHLSFQRICTMPAAFRRELALRMLADVAGDEPLRMFLEVPSVERRRA